MLDATDVEYVSTRLDHFASLYKADVSHRLHSLLKRHESDKQTIAAQSQAIQHLQHSIDGLTERVSLATQTSASLTTHHHALRHRCLTLLASSHHHLLLQRVLLSWQHVAHYSSLTRRRALSHRRRALQRTFLVRWRETVRAEKAARVDGYWRGEMKRVREEAVRDSQAEVVRLKEELKELMVTVRMGDRELNDREERMKAAFVRGVCALNKEAMAVFSTDALMEEKDAAGQWAPAAGASSELSDLSASGVSSIAQAGSTSAASSSGMGSSGAGTGLGASTTQGSRGVVAFQPIPLRLSHPYPPVQVPVVTRSGGGGMRDGWEGARGAVPRESTTGSKGSRSGGTSGSDALSTRGSRAHTAKR